MFSLKKIASTMAVALALGTGIALAPVNQAPAEAVPYALPAGTWGAHCYTTDTLVGYYRAYDWQIYEYRHKTVVYKYWNGYRWYCAIRSDYYYSRMLT